MVYIFTDGKYDRTITNVVHDPLNNCYYYNEILDNGEVGRFMHVISETTFKKYVKEVKYMTYLYDLQPQYDRRKSFYGKAKVYKDDKGHLFLKSYDTIVAEITDGIATSSGRPTVKVNGWYSQTTARHINDFLYQHGFNTMSKKQMEED